MSYQSIIKLNIVFKKSVFVAGFLFLYNIINIY